MWGRIEEGMKNNEVRVCDICEKAIPKGATFQMLIFPSRNMNFHLHLKGIKKTATWTQIDKDKIQLDICQDCQKEIESCKEMELPKGLYSTEKENRN